MYYREQQFYKGRPNPRSVEPPRPPAPEPPTQPTGWLGYDLNFILFLCGMAFAAGVLFLAMLILALKLELPPAVNGLFNVLVPLLLFFLFGWFAVFCSLRLWHWHKNSLQQSRQYKSANGELALVELEISTATGKKKTVYFNPVDKSFIDPAATVNTKMSDAELPQWLALRVEEEKTARLVALGDALAQAAGSDPTTSSTLGNVLAHEYGVNLPPSPAPASVTPPPTAKPEQEVPPAPELRIWWLNRASGEVDPAAPVTELIEKRQITAQNLRPELPNPNAQARTWRVQPQPHPAQPFESIVQENQ